MATQNLTRKQNRNSKKKVSVLSATVDYTDEIATTDDIYELFSIPPDALITSAQILVETASDAGTSAVADVGFAGGDTLIDGVDLTSADGTVLSGGANAVVPQDSGTGKVVTFKPTFTGATTVGKFTIIVEIAEYTMANGELVNFSAT
jgi:hypothetical protein